MTVMFQLQCLFRFYSPTVKGQFVQTMQYGGHWYGLSRESIEHVAREGLACCVHMELEVWHQENMFHQVNIH